MNAVWLMFLPIFLILLSSSRSKNKKYKKKIRRLKRKGKEKEEMSRLLEELKGKSVTVFTSGSGLVYTILDADEDWVKLSQTDKKGNSKTKLVPLEEIQSIEF